MDKLVEQEPVCERLVRDHRVHERDCGHVREVRQIGRGEPHLDELTVERRISHALATADYKASQIEDGLREKGYMAFFWLTLRGAAPAR